MLILRIEGIGSSGCALSDGELDAGALLIKALGGDWNVNKLPKV